MGTHTFYHETSKYSWNQIHFYESITEGKKQQLHITIIHTDVRFVEDVDKTANY